jgi:hypothetical protein
MLETLHDDCLPEQSAGRYFKKSVFQVFRQKPRVFFK